MPRSISQAAPSVSATGYPVVSSETLSTMGAFLILSANRAKGQYGECIALNARVLADGELVTFFLALNEQREQLLAAFAESAEPIGPVIIHKVGKKQQYWAFADAPDAPEGEWTDNENAPEPTPDDMPF